MNYFVLVNCITIVFIFSKVGEYIVELSGTFIPSSIIGLILLFIMLATKVIKVSWFKDFNDLNQKYMTLFFVPISVGVFYLQDEVSNIGLKLVALNITTSFASIIIIGYLLQKMVK